MSLVQHIKLETASNARAKAKIAAQHKTEKLKLTEWTLIKGKIEASIQHGRNSCIASVDALCYDWICDGLKEFGYKVTKCGGGSRESICNSTYLVEIDWSKDLEPELKLEPELMPDEKLVVQIESTDTKLAIESVESSSESVNSDASGDTLQVPNLEYDEPKPALLRTIKQQYDESNEF